MKLWHSALKTALTEQADVLMGIQINDFKKSYNGSYTHDYNETLKQRELSSCWLYWQGEEAELSSRGLRPNLISACNCPAVQEWTLQILHIKTLSVYLLEHAGFKATLMATISSQGPETPASDWERYPGQGLLQIHTRQINKRVSPDLSYLRSSRSQKVAHWQNEQPVLTTAATADGQLPPTVSQAPFTIMDKPPNMLHLGKARELGSNILKIKPSIKEGQITGCSCQSRR